MKTVSGFTAGAIILLASLSGNAAQLQGRVLCDADGDGLAGITDSPLANVQVVVKNSNGTYSDATATTFDGSFSLILPDAPDTYVAYLDAPSLPPGTTAVIPPNGIWSFQISSRLTSVAADFLVKTPGCVRQPIVCWLSASGTELNGKGKTEFRFDGSVTPGCPSATGSSGTWNHTAESLKLQLRGIVTNTLAFGNVGGSGSYIVFSGMGTLKGTGGNRASYPRTSFVARVEDRSNIGEPARYYLRVCDARGMTLLLVSADPANPLKVAPEPVSSAKVQVRFGTCDNPPQ